MIKSLTRWIGSLVLALGLASSAFAGGNSGHGHSGHGHGGGSGIEAVLSKVFVNDAGESFAKVVNFKLEDLSLMTLNVASFGLGDLSFSIFDKKTQLEVYDSGSFAGSISDSFSLTAGKYFAIFSGSVVSSAAGYVGVLTAAPVPEPAEWMMIIAGIAMMGFVVARRRQV